MSKNVTACLVCSVAAAAVSLLVDADVSAQSLAEVARQEEMRRKAIESPARLYTNADLGRGALTTAAPRPASVTTRGNAAAAATEPAGEAQDAQTQEGETADRRGEEYWRNRITTVREQRSRTELLRDAVQNRVDSLQADFTARDDPFQRAAVFADRQQALAELANLEAEIERLNQETADIEQEARRAGVPPGWLR